MQRNIAVILLRLLLPVSVFASSAAEQTAAGRASLDRNEHEKAAAPAKASYAGGLKLAPNDKDLSSALRSVS
ncbi:MAG TPA: hypothetical protein VFO89_17500 [Thermoanaerobaculia bacterium]|nr:hypothetical protein [Thermoanaerobaculia bacterium]